MAFGDMFGYWLLLRLIVRSHERKTNCYVWASDGNLSGSIFVYVTMFGQYRRSKDPSFHCFAILRALHFAMSRTNQCIAQRL